MRFRLSIPFGTLLGAKLRIHILLPVFIALSVWLDALPYYLMLFALVFGHELCHTLAARALGIEVLEIELAPFGGVARVASDMELRPVCEIVVALAGPAFNVLLVFLAAFAERYWILDPERLSSFIGANLLLAGFNLLPALPLDGGRVLRAALALPFGLTRATKIASWTGVCAGILVLALAMYNAIYGAINITFFLCGAMLIVMALREGRGAETLYLRDITARERALYRDGALPVRWIAAASDSSVRSVVRRFRPNSYHRVIMLDGGLRECGSLTEEELVHAMMHSHSETPLKKIRQHRLP